MRKRKASRDAVEGEGDGAADWETTRTKARHPEAEQRAPRLPVRAAAADAEGDWVADVQPRLEALPAVPVVQGITVVDDLAAELERQRQEQEEEQARQQQQQRQQRQQQQGSKHARPEAQRRTATGLDALRGIQSKELRRQAAKQQLATAAQQLLQDPEKQLPQLRALLELLRDEDAQVCRLAMLTLLAVFRDLIPAYRIRPVHEEEAPEQLSKEVRALRAYESALLDCYHTYLKGLLKAFKGSNGGQVPLQQGRIAVKCMAGLLETAPHFNYRSDLLQALVSCLPHKDEQIRDAAQAGLTTLLAGSYGDGEVATEAVQLIADLVRRWKCVMPAASLDCLLGLRFPDITAPPAAVDSGSRKKQKKRRKERDEVDRSFLEAQAAADLASRQSNQTATLDALFELLFRVLKNCSTSGLVRQADAAPMSRRHFMKKFPLLFPALRVLSKFVHLISVDYINDITAELRQLLGSGALPPQERLRVLLTAAETVQSQSGALSVEHAGFYAELYAALKHAMLVPLLDASWQGGAGGGDAGGAAEEEQEEEEELLSSALAADDLVDTRIGGQVCYMLPQVLSSLLLESRTLDAARQAAFLKRMAATAAAAGDTGLAMGLLCVLQRLLRRSRRLQGMLQHEAGGPSTQGYRPEVDDPAEAGALAAPLWELSMLAQHFHPGVASAAAQLAAGGPVPALPLSGSAGAFGASFTNTTGAFNPPPAQPRSGAPLRSKRA